MPAVFFRTAPVCPVFEKKKRATTHTQGGPAPFEDLLSFNLSLDTNVAELTATASQCFYFLMQMKAALHQK